MRGERSAPPWARLEIKLKMSFQALFHSLAHERALALTSPTPDFLFSSIHQKPTIPQSAIADGGGFAGFVAEKLWGAICRKGDPWCGPPLVMGLSYDGISF